MMPFLYRGHFVFLKNPRITASGINTSALLGLVNGLASILSREHPTHAVLAMDPGGPTFRHEAYPPYKAQRQKMPEDLAECIPYAFELADALGIPVLRADGFEADDVMGTLAVKGAEAGFDVYMATPDKDAAQLVRPGVRLFRPGRSGDEAEIYDEELVRSHWHLSGPAQMIDYLALAGDSSDNIPGIRGVGEKTAAELLSRFGTVENIIANAASIKGRLGEKVASGEKDALMSKFLATIRTDVPLDFKWEDFELAPPDPAKLAPVCAKYELNRLAKAFSLEMAESGAAASGKIATIADTPHDYRLVKTPEEANALLEELSKHDPIAFDTETEAFGSHASTEAHFCKLTGFSFATAPGKAWYVTGDLVDVFRPLFADPARTFIAHNAKFDLSVLRSHGIGVASTVRDTMLEDYCLDSSARHSLDALSERCLGYRPIPIEALIGEKERGKEQLSMGSLPPEKILDYAAEDADVAFRLDSVLRAKVAEAGASAALETSEEPLVKTLIDMEREGVRIDVNALKEYGAGLEKEILSLYSSILKYAPPQFNPDSPKQLGDLLFGVLGLPADGVRKTSTGQYSTDEKTLVKLEHCHPVIHDILEYRACTKLKSTYVDKLPKLIDANGRVHTTYSQAFTETGRLSSSDPNLQNIPIRTERGKPIRKAFIARDDRHVLVSADYSQVELRLMAAFSGDGAMLDAFRRGEDIHRDTAARVFDVMPAFVTPEQRSRCKMVNFGIIYGISAFGLSQRLGIARKEAAALIETYFKQYPKVKAFMEEAVEKARSKGYATTILGRRRTLRDINSRNATARQAAERDAINTPIQGSAADLIKVAMVRIDKVLRERALRSRMVLQIHDELVFDVPKEEEAEVVEIVRREMSGAIDFGVPLEVSVGSGPDWLSAH